MQLSTADMHEATKHRHTCTLPTMHVLIKNILPGNWCAKQQGPELGKQSQAGAFRQKQELITFVIKL